MTEIERKFLVRGEPWRGVAGENLRQVYLRADVHCSVRLRLGENRAWLTIKGQREGITRGEWEYPIPLDDAEEMLAQLKPKERIDKMRYRLEAGAGLVWEIDVFQGANAGLVIAEIELPSEDTDFARPAWLGEEVSGDPRYGNIGLTRHAWPSW